MKDDQRPTVAQIDLTLEPSSIGSVESKVVDPAVERVMFVPADEEGNVPRWSPRLVGEGLVAKVKNGKALFQGLRRGKYVFYAENWDWGSKSSHELFDSDGKRRFIYIAPNFVIDPGDPPKITGSLEVKAKSVTRGELK